MKLSAQLFGKDLSSFYLEVGRLRILTVRYDRYVDGLFILSGSALVITRRTIRRELSIPFFCRFYPAVVTGKSIVDNKMTIRILLIGNTAQRAQLFNLYIQAGCDLIAGANFAIVNFDPLPVPRSGST